MKNFLKADQEGQEMHREEEVGGKQSGVGKGRRGQNAKKRRGDEANNPPSSSSPKYETDFKKYDMKIEAEESEVCSKDIFGLVCFSAKNCLSVFSAKNVFIFPPKIVFSVYGAKSFLFSRQKLSYLFIWRQK